MPSEADIIFNRANVALAKSQRLIASWLPPKTYGEADSMKTEEELDTEDRETFAPVPELLGVGAAAPKDATNKGLKRSQLSSDDKLLQQLLGKKAAKKFRDESITKPRKSLATHSAKLKPKTGRLNVQLVSEDEDEDEGRTALIKSRNLNHYPRRKELESVANGDMEAGVKSEDEVGELANPPSSTPVASKTSGKKGSNRVASSYLDEILGQRTSKKRKKS